MYQNEEQVAFLRLDGGNRRMAPFDISRTINEQVRKHYQPIIDKLKAQIDEKLSKLNIPSELKNEIIDYDHAGMARDLGHVIQPNLDRACNPSTIWTFFSSILQTAFLSSIFWKKYSLLKIDIFRLKHTNKMPSAEELAASLEAGESYDDQYMAGHGGWSSFFQISVHFRQKYTFLRFINWNSYSGKNRTKAESGQKQAANADPSRKAVSAVVNGENARKK